MSLEQIRKVLFSDVFELEKESKILKEKIMEILSNNNPKSIEEIIFELKNQFNIQVNRHTTFYSILSKMKKEGLIKRVGRGIYGKGEKYGKNYRSG